ncbi:MAG: type II toxin-antitoxin system PemK/MazF family toxin [Planctomycetia bacterium]|nr:type II toxin-antitoxin system PemK/MazF family toxin [Planctomycetia bacterium]
MSRPVNRGEIYLIDVTEQEKQAGNSQPVSVSGEEKRKERPYLVVSRDELNRGFYVTAVPLYSQQLEERRKHRSAVFFSAGDAGLNKDCVAKCDEIGPLDKADMPLARGPIGKADAEKMMQIVNAIRFCIRDHTVTANPAK